jgi:hypothetical protein
MKKLMTAVFALSALFAASGNPSQAASAAQSTCTGLKLACLSRFDSKPEPRYYHVGSRCFYLGASTPAPAACCENLCNSTWDQCIKTGFWEGTRIHRPAERR